MTIVRKLRLQRGWSQSQLAELTDVSTRTIQRIEGGQLPSVETAKALAAVFEVSFHIFRQEDTVMTTDSINSTRQPDPGPDPRPDHRPDSQPGLSLDEQAAIAKTKRIKAFYEAVLTYCLLLGVFAFFLYDRPGFYLLFGALGIALVAQGLLAFERISFLSPGWEKRQIEKLLGRQL